MRNVISNLLAVYVKQGRVLGQPFIFSFFSTQNYKLFRIRGAPFSSFSKGIYPSQLSVGPLKDVSANSCFLVVLGNVQICFYPFFLLLVLGSFDFSDSLISRWNRAKNLKWKILRRKRRRKKRFLFPFYIYI